MVIQQDCPFRIWGTAEINTVITLKADWLTKPTKVLTQKDGEWEGYIHVPKAIIGDYSQHQLSVSSETENIILNEILIGDIWVASGQSNMQFRMSCEDNNENGVLNFREEIASANFPNIRLYFPALNFKIEPFEELYGTWEICSSQTVQFFSGLAYYYARELFF